MVIPSKGTPERRDSRRRHIFIPIVCREIQNGKSSGPNIQIILKEISEEGVGFLSKVIYSVGTELATEMYLPTRNVPITPTICIERVEAVAGTETYSIGARFGKIDPEETKAISH